MVERSSPLILTCLITHAFLSLSHCLHIYHILEKQALTILPTLAANFSIFHIHTWIILYFFFTPIELNVNSSYIVILVHTFF